MQHHESVSFNMFRHPHNILTFKTKMLRLDSNEGRVKRLLLLHQQLI